MSVNDHLHDEIRLREASLEDARRERDAGELSTAAFERLARREAAAIATARTELGQRQRSQGVPGTGPTRRHKRGWLLVALSSFAAAVVVLVATSLTLRQAGTSVTGGVSATGQQQITQLLVEGEGDLAAGNDVAAVSAYQRIVRLDSHNVAALTELGWLDFSAGSQSASSVVVTRGVGQLALAVQYAPRDPAPRLYYAIAATSTPGNRPLALRQFRTFLRLHPTAVERAIAAPYLRQLGL